MEWRFGTPSQQSKLICLDPKRANIGLMAAEVFDGGVPAIVENLTESIPDSQERKEFVQKIIEEYRSEQNKLCFCAYKTTTFKSC